MRFGPQLPQLGGTRLFGVVLSVLASMGPVSGAFAQQPLPPQVPPDIPRPPSAGQILQEVTPPQTPPGGQRPDVKLPTAPARPRAIVPEGGPKIVVKEISFKGNTVFSDAQLRALVAPLLAKPVGGSELQLVESRVTEHYQKAGYFLAQAYFEPQDVTTGRLELSVLEGKVGKLRIEKAPDAPVPDRLVEGLLRNVKQGQPLRQSDLERAMLLLADTPGITAQASLEAGVEPGTTDLIIEINKGRRWRASVYADNWGTYYTGYYRLGGTFRWLSPLGLGDELDISPLITSESEVLYGGINYDLPLGNTGWRGSVGGSYMTYVLGQELAALGGAGYASTFNLAAAYPLIRSRAENLFLRLSYDYIKLQDRYDTVDFEVNKHINGIGANLNYEKRDNLRGGGYNSASATVFGGNLDIQTPSALTLDQSPIGLHTQGDFVKLNVILSRLQALWGPITAYFGAFGQLPNKNLDNSQRIALGGPTAVRAYPASEGIVDQGAVATAELRWGATQDLTLSAFYDAGWGDIAKSLPNGIPGDNSVTLRGYGLGLTWFKPGLG